MEVTDGKKFCIFMKGVRKRTKSVCSEVPSDKANWRLGDGMSAIDIIIHIAQVEQALWGSSLRNGKVSSFIEPADEERASLNGSLHFAERLRRENDAFWKSLSIETLNSEILSPTGDKIVLSRWLTLAPEHEIHLRSFIHAYRKFWGLESHPIYGLTLKQLEQLVKN